MNFYNKIISLINISVNKKIISFGTHVTLIYLINQLKLKTLFVINRREFELCENIIDKILRCKK